MATPSEPLWLQLARREVGTKERPGKLSNPAIGRYFADAGHPSIRDDAVAWCAAFVGACLARSGVKPTGSLMARSYLAWGQRLRDPRVGAIAVFARGTDVRFGHVGFVVGWSESEVRLLGGNQADRVSIDTLPRARLLGLRWPATEPILQSASQSADHFATALALVLQFEGGFVDDPADPGGATCRGITLATLAAYRKKRVTSTTRPALVAELRQLDEQTASDIYRRRYWTVAQCDRLPAGLSLMHFDAAVLHGPSRAARLLQQALGVTVDGDVGPQTLAAAAARPTAETINRYGELRRARLIASKGAARFGRGWMARLDRTLAAAHAATKPTQVVVTSTIAKETSNMPIPSKWWGKSVTIWGTLITALSTVLPLVGPLIGIELSSDMIRGIGEQFVVIAQAAGGIIGTLLAIYGRARATSGLVQRQVKFHL